MDKFVNRFRQQLEENPNATNHLNNSSTNRSKISSYFKVKAQPKPNSISIDCSSDDDDDDIDMQIVDDPLLRSNRNRNNTNTTQQSLTQFLKPTEEINAQTKEQKLQQEHAQYDYLYVAPLMNQRHLLELTELSGLRNAGSAQRLSRIRSQNVYNINADILHRRHLHLIINNTNLHRLPMRHSFDNTLLSNDYISAVKFDKMGSLFCAASTNGTVGIFDFDHLQTKWNNKARIHYNSHIMRLQKQNELKVEAGEEDVVDIKQYAFGANVASMENVMEITIDTQFRIEDIEWSPNMNDVAVCGHAGGCLNIYDLRRTSNKPKHRLKSKNSPTHPLLNIKYSPTQSSCIASGDRMGSVFVWDLKQKTSKPCVHMNAVAKQTSFIGNRLNGNRDGTNMSSFAVKHLSMSSDGVLLYVVRENGFIQIMDIRKAGYVYKTIDLWRCALDGDKDTKNSSNGKFYNESVGSQISTSHRARIDDAMILHSMNTALLKLQNNSLVNVHLPTNAIRKTYHGDYNFKGPSPSPEAIDIGFLSRVRQRRMCSFENYGMPQMMITGSFNKEMVVIDVSTELDAHYADQEYKQKRVNLGLMNKDNAKDESSNMQNSFKARLDDQSYGFMGYCELSDVLTSCTLHPKSLYTVCGTVNNCLEIVACASNPF
eukprot:59945_1